MIIAGLAFRERKVRRENFRKKAKGGYSLVRAILDEYGFTGIKRTYQVTRS